MNNTSTHPATLSPNVTLYPVAEGMEFTEDQRIIGALVKQLGGSAVIERAEFWGVKGLMVSSDRVPDTILLAAE